MAYNLFLALIPVVTGWIMYKDKSKTIKWLCGIIWFLFLPNTIYIVTDLIHLPDDLARASHAEALTLVCMYAIFTLLGIATFIFSLISFEKTLGSLKLYRKKSDNHLAILLVNVFTGFGVVLGRVLRLNSWEVLTNSHKAFSDTLSLFRSSELLLLSLGFAAGSYIVYALFRKKASRFSKEYLGL